MLACACVCSFGLQSRSLQNRTVIPLHTQLPLAEIVRSQRPREKHAHPLNTRRRLLALQPAGGVSTWRIKETEAERSKTSLAALFCAAPLDSDANACRAIRQRGAGEHARMHVCTQSLGSDGRLGRSCMWKPAPSQLLSPLSDPLPP